MKRGLVVLVCAWAFVSGVAYLLADSRSSGRAETIRDTENVSCLARNSIVRQINAQNTAFLLHNEITRDTFATNPNDPALRKAAHLYSEIATAYRVLPLTDCLQAIGNPRSYVLPKSRLPTQAELRRAYRKFLGVHRKHVRP